MSSPVLPASLQRKLSSIAVAQVLSTLLLLVPALYVTPAQADSATKSYQIAPGPLKQALNQFGRDAQVMISFSSELTAGLTSPGLNDNVSLQDGLGKLLQGTGLEAVEQANGGFLLRKAANPSHTSSTLEEVTVKASKDATSENTGSYTTSATAAATKLPLSLRHTPQSVSVITRSRMDDQNLTQLQDVLEQTVGISVVQSGYVGANWNTFQSRGFTISNYLVDGVPMRNGFELMTSDMAFYDRLEIVRGATGLMQGVGSPAGSINFVRKKPTRDFQASVTGQLGSWDNYRGMLDISTPLNEDGSVRGRVVAVKQDSGSYIERFGLQREMLYGIVEADISPDTLFTAGLEYQNHETHDSPEAGLPLVFSNGAHTQWKRSKNPGAEWAYSENEKLGFFTSLEHSFANQWRGKIQFNHSRNRYDSMIGAGGSGSLNAVTGSGVTLWGGRWQAKPVQNAVDISARGPFTFAGREHELVVGVNYSYTDYKAPNYRIWDFIPVSNYYNWNGAVRNPDIPVTGHNDFMERQLGAYLTARFKPTDQWAILAGGRVIHWHRSTDTYGVNGSYAHAGRAETGVFTPYLATTYDLNSQASLYASYTKIFSSQTSMDVNGNYLDPLEGHSYEAGIKHELYGGRLNTSLAVFRVEQDNEAVRDGTRLAPNGGAAYTAEKGTLSRGFEAEINGEVAPGWQVGGGYTFRISQKANGDKIQTVTPQNLFKLFTSYRLPGEWNKLVLGGGVNWQSRIYTNDTGPAAQRFTQGSYAVVNLMARYQWNDHFYTALNVNNLFDKTYYTNTGANMGFYGTPRNAMLTFNYQF